jgi:bifunctional ADP-heptose synthase (sugar kinase/adenylyltransferase)
VVGDTIIDEYHYCQAMGKSPKELLVTTRYLREEAFAGGVLACANHVAGFCDRVDLVTCLGRQETREEFIRHHLRSNISPTFFFREDTPTIVKRRYVEPAFLSKMFEVCFLDDRPLPAPLEYEVAEHLRRILPEYDLVVVADYGHGFLSSTLVQAVAESARFLVVNTQTNSANTGYNLIIKWPRADYVCIDEPEVRLAFRDRFGPLPELVEAVVKVLGSRMVTITRGHLGSLTYRPDSGSYETPVFSREIVDRVGAGDAYLAVTAPCVAAGWPADLVGFVGNAVGALAVRIVGNRSPVEPVTLYKFITALLK